MGASPARRFPPPLLDFLPSARGEYLARIRDVAQLAGVSPMTVSRALNRPEVVSPETRARVLNAVRELGYVPNGVARSLSQGRTNVIALVLADIQNPFFTTLSRGVEDV